MNSLMKLKEGTIIPVYKPKGITSHAALIKIKKIILKSGTRVDGLKIGHAGTLDPLAEGVLVVGIGREATKKLADEVKKEKEYIVTIKFGYNSTTDDEEGEKTKIFDAGFLKGRRQMPQKSEVKKVLKKFVGKILQTPPAYSAVKIKGKEAYKFARKGLAIKLNPRKVFIKNIELISYDWPLLEIKAVTGPGVYIRSLARDIGAELGTGGYIAQLIRTRVGQYKIEDSVRI